MGLGEDFGGDFRIIVLASVAQSDVTNGSKSCSSCDAANWTGKEMSMMSMDRMNASNSVFETTQKASVRELVARIGVLNGPMMKGFDDIRN